MTFLGVFKPLTAEECVVSASLQHTVRGPQQLSQDHRQRPPTHLTLRAQGPWRRRKRARTGRAEADEAHLAPITPDQLCHETA